MALKPHSGTFSSASNWPHAQGTRIMSKNEATNRAGVGLATTAFERNGFTFREQPTSDFGIDAHVEMRDVEQSPTGQLLAVQLKTGQSYLEERVEGAIVYRPKSRHVEYWLEHSLPVIVALCDEQRGAVYWAHVSPEAVESTGVGFKILVPKHQVVDDANRKSLTELVTPLVSSSLYTVFRLDDTSHALAKRYSAEIVLSGPRTKAEVAAVVRQATLEHMGRSYYRNELTRERFGDSNADVVATFVYLNATDQGRKTWICRGLWISDALPEESRPNAFDGENVGMGIIVDWSEIYEEVTRITEEHTLSKEGYVDLLDRTLARIAPLVSDFQDRLRLHEQGALTDSQFVSETLVVRQGIRALYMESTDFDLAPFECGEVDQKLQELLAYADNAAVVYEKDGQFPGRAGMARGYLNDYERTLVELKYEAKKVR